ncbi:MAG: hypothetical protein COS92_01560 [Desulfobacterales bacterium CG07_land_8_20_14_0_80_52_14]|nr:MAG: hypothetical protein COS92_01560 [Desulfobacterales bacterium CG07_land_8_20_14_0_80_52_14]
MSPIVPIHGAFVIYEGVCILKFRFWSLSILIIKPKSVPIVPASNSKFGIREFQIKELYFISFFSVIPE